MKNNIFNTLVYSGGESFQFIKCHASGNDFIIMDAGVLEGKKEQFIKNICNRRFGIGCDQLIAISFANNRITNKEKDDTTDISVKLYNSNGSIAKMCGNAMRCIGGLFFLEGKDSCTVNIIAEKVEKKVKITKQPFGKVKVYIGEFKLKNKKWRHATVEIGNKHIIKIAPDIALNTEDFFATKRPNNKYNVSYITKIRDNCIHVDSIERGVGKTLCCGSGVCASVIYAVSTGLLDKNQKQLLVTTDGTKGEELSVEVIFDAPENSQQETVHTFTGTVYLCGSWNMTFIGSAKISDIEPKDQTTNIMLATSQRLETTAYTLTQ